MKKKWAYFFVIMILCVSFLSGCGFQALSGGPALNAAVTGNGGLSVQKGDYLYFVNGYVSTDDLVEGDNVYNEVDNASIYRALLTNGELTYDTDGNLLNCDIVVPKIVGFENAGIYIFDNSIYYATPNTEKGDDGKIDFTLIDFCRANLDGSKVTNLYKTDTSSDSTSYSFYKIGSTVYLVVFDGTKLVSINTESKAITTIAETVSSVVLPSVTEYNADNNTIAASQTYVYYTRSANDDETINFGNVLAKASIASGAEIIIQRNNTSTYTVEQVTIDALYYTKKNQSDASAYYFLTEFANDELDFNSEKQLAYSAYTSTVLYPGFENGFERGIITTNASGYAVWIKVVNEVPTYTTLYSTSTLTLMYVQGDYLYGYDSSKEIVKINYKTLTSEIITTADDIVPYFTPKTNFDFDSGNIYFYNTITNTDYTSYYLVRISTAGNSERTLELVGRMETIHLPEEEEA